MSSSSTSHGKEKMPSFFSYLLFVPFFFQPLRFCAESCVVGERSTYGSDSGSGRERGDGQVNNKQRSKGRRQNLGVISAFKITYGTGRCMVSCWKQFFLRERVRWFLSTPDVLDLLCLPKMKYRPLVKISEKVQRHAAGAVSLGTANLDKNAVDSMEHGNLTVSAHVLPKTSMTPEQ